MDCKGRFTAVSIMLSLLLVYPSTHCRISDTRYAHIPIL